MIDTLITALSKELELSAEEIADTIWLALQIQETQSESTATQKFDLPQPPLKSNDREILPEAQTHGSKSEETASKHPPDEQKAGIYPRNQQETLSKSELSFKVPDAPSLREPLTLARALKPLMRRIPSSKTLVFDEAATTQQIANEGLWLPVLRPTLEPWFDLELVVDESISMQIWRHTIKELERLLKNYGIFRDVRVWGLIADNLEQVQIRRGIGATAKNQSPRSPAELIDPSGRRLVLVVSDCVSSLWRNGKVAAALEIWAKQGSMAIVQVLPKWLWKRTALGRASEVRLQGLNPGEFNQKLIAKEVSLWDELEETRGVKVPVFTLEPDQVATWAQMLSGKGSIWTSGYVFKLDSIPVNKGRQLFNLDCGQLSAEQRVQAFRVTASPMARKLAGLLAAAPVISLPIVRLIQGTLLKESQQVHVAEVFLGGLLKPLSEINAETNPDRVRYEFMDGVRELLVDSVPSGYVLNVVDEVSKYVARKVGLSLEDFAAVLRTPQQLRDSGIAGDFGYFATVTAQILRHLGGDYARLANSLENNIAVDNLTTEFEQNRRFLWQQGNTSIYSICTDKPWYLPFDALVIPSGYKIGLQGSFAQYFQASLGEETVRLIHILIDRALDENQLSVISPESPLFVSLPSEIKSHFPQTDSSQSNKFLVFATVEDLEPSIAGAFKAAEAIIFKIAERGIARVVLPLLGTGRNNLLVNKVAIAMLSAITQSFKKLSSNPIKEIIIVEQHESAIEIINQVAQSLLDRKNTYKVELLSEAGIDYTQLRNLLEAGKWREADEETARLMLQASGQEERGWLDEEDMKAFPSIDLQTIDQLWSKYSNGRFGFSVQKRIWENIGGTEDYDNEIIGQFSDLVGWRKKEVWLTYSEINFDLNAPEGHLPVIGENGWWERPWEVSSLAQKMTNVDVPGNQTSKEGKKQLEFSSITVSPIKVNPKVLDEEVINQINTLALKVKEYPSHSLERRRALNKLIKAVNSSGKVYRVYELDYGVYEEILQETWIEILNKIDEYNPEKVNFISWFNHILYSRCRFVIKKQSNETMKVRSLDVSLSSFDELESINLLDEIPAHSQARSTIEELREFIEKDPQGIFASSYIKNNPEANFRAILLRRFEEKRWDTIARELNISTVALVSFYQRCINKFTPVFKEYLQE